MLNGTGGALHVFFSDSRTVPAVGQTATGSTETLPSGKTAARGISSDGASVSRGGFGGSGSDGSHGS